MIFRCSLLLLWVALALATEWKGWPDEELFEITTKCIQRGKDRYKQMQDAISQGKDDAKAMPWCEVEKEWSPRISKPMNAKGISARLDEFISTAQLGIDTSGNNFVEITESFPNKKVSPGDANSAYYENGYNTKDNVIAVVDINRQDKAGTDVSTLTWSTWVKACADAEADASKLSQLIHYTCRNELADHVSVDIFGDEVGANTFYEFTPGDDKKNEPFYALLGLDNGTGAKNIAINYQKTLGHKTLKSIVAWQDEGTGGIMGVSYRLG